MSSHALTHTTTHTRDAPTASSQTCHTASCSSWLSRLSLARPPARARTRPPAAHSAISFGTVIAFIENLSVFVITACIGIHTRYSTFTLGPGLFCAPRAPRGRHEQAAPSAAREPRGARWCRRARARAHAHPCQPTHAHAPRTSRCSAAAATSGLNAITCCPFQYLHPRSRDAYAVCKCRMGRPIRESDMCMHSVT